MIFDFVETIFTQAESVYNDNDDESTWYPIVKSVLTGTVDIQPPLFVAKEAIRKPVDGSLLPLDRDPSLIEGGKANPLPIVKVDFLLEFNRVHPALTSQLSTYFATHPPNSYLGAVKDASSGRTLTFMSVEVTPTYGDYSEAGYQLALMSVAIITRLINLDKEKSHITPSNPVSESNSSNSQIDLGYLPVPGFVIVGHIWSLHWHFRTTDGSFRQFGPYPCGDTGTRLGIYMLLGVVEKLKDWGRTAYLPYALSKL